MSGLVVDLFAGGGGASLGVERALGRHVDIGLNHSWDALRNHALNHPKTRHLVDDIRAIDPLVATGGQPVDVLWASPDCKHFSRCKGGKPLDESVRTLPWEVTRWASATRPRLICVENVPEMSTWGPLDAEGYPIMDRKGETFAAWEQAFRDLGYRVAKGLLRACDFGAPTSRRRLFVVARRDGAPRLPEPTHGTGLLPYRTAAECIDWSDLGESIFGADGRTRHAEATLRRIAKGIVRFVLGAGRPFLVQTGNGERRGQAPRCMSADAPLGTVVAGGQKHALVSAFIAKHYGGMVGHDLRRPLGTITAVDHHSAVAAHLIRTDNQSDGRLRGLASPEEPLRTVTTSNGHALVAAFLSTYYGQSVGRGVGEPMATLTTKDRHALVTVEIDGVTYAIVDIRMRMLKPSELKLAQGFPESYRLDGTQKLQVALIGNSVPPQLSEAVVGANVRPWVASWRGAGPLFSGVA